MNDAIMFFTSAPAVAVYLLISAILGGLTYYLLCRVVKGYRDG